MRASALLSILSFGLAIQGGNATAQQRVSIELLLAIDTSLSVNDLEYELQIRGIAEALRDPEVLTLIEAHNGVALGLMQWAGWTEEGSEITWKLVNSPQSVLEFASRIEALPRANVGIHTAIGTAIEAGVASIRANSYRGDQLKMDISGDGVSNAGPLPAVSRQLAEVSGISINALAILTDHPSLDRYYQAEVITGPGAFVMQTDGYEDFEAAIKRKLLRELQPAISDRGNRSRRFAER